MLSMSSSNRSMPVGQRAAHREEVDQAAADAELARRDDLRDVLVAGERELRAQRVDVEARRPASRKNVNAARYDGGASR